ncbi:MAG: hypothetical protein JO126_08690 [Alphaproteobacteria bacterium]|nr:hypothetical protein [Alphaproteobacteria bacterium]MBV8549519.1 hypothetical protein [Alphaproteobacteria bacterium]
MTDNVTLILSAIMMVTMVFLIAPGVFAVNRGHILHNIALWLAIFLALGLFYHNFGPESPHPLFKIPEAMTGLRHNAPAPTPQAPTPEPTTPAPAPAPEGKSL